MLSRCSALAWVALVACGGSPDTGSQPSTESLVADFCGKMATAPVCGSAQAQSDCLTDMAKRRTQADQERCESQLDEYLICAKSRPLECTGYDQVPLHPIAASECGPALQAFSRCYTHLPDGCSVGAGSGTCSIKCQTLSSLCHGPDPNGPVDCTCDSGPHVGTSFQASDCSQSLSWATGHQCNY